MSDAVKKLVLHHAHAEHGARFSPFAGYEMPMQYTGIKAEHHAVRTAVGVFDVSHMGEFFFTGPDAVSAVDRIVTNDITSLPLGKAAYTVMCREDGGIVDDLIVYKLAPDRVMAIVNASRLGADWAHMNAHLAGDVALVDRSDAYVLLAIQGPKAEATLNAVVKADLCALAFFGVVETEAVDGTPVTIGRTGYTGEDGFEVLIPNASASGVFGAVMEAGAAHGIVLAGLGARDTLRLEAKFPLYGNDITLDTNPIEAGLGWVVKMKKAVEFVGRDALVRVRSQGVTRRLRGVVMTERGVLRAGYALFAGDEQVGTLTSGSMGPTVGHAIGVGYVDLAHVESEHIEVEIRGRRIPVTLTKRAFYQRPATA